QDLGVAELDEHRAFGMHGVVAGDAHGAQLVGGAGAGAGERGHGCCRAHGAVRGLRNRECRAKPSAACLCLGGASAHRRPVRRAPPHTLRDAERRMASLISAIERSMASSSRSSTSPSSGPAWMVEANTSSLMLSVDTPWVDSNASGVSHSMARTVTLSLLSPALRNAVSTNSGTA